MSASSSIARAPPLVRQTNKAPPTCACKGDRQKLFDAINKFGFEKTNEMMPELIKKAKQGQWLARNFFVKNCNNTWKACSTKRGKKRKAGVSFPMVSQVEKAEIFMQRSKMKVAALELQLNAFKAKVKELKLQVEIHENAQLIVQLKEKIGK